MGPFLITFHKAAEETVPVGLILPSSNEKSPGLLVVGRRRPAGRFKEAVQFVRLYWSFGKCARAPTSPEKIMKRMMSFSRFFHPSVPNLFVSLTKFSLGLQPVLHLTSFRSTTFEVDFVGSPFDILTCGFRSRCGSFPLGGLANGLRPRFLGFTLRHGCLLDEGHELTVGGSLHRLRIISSAALLCLGAGTLASLFRQPASAQGFVELNYRHQMETTGGGKGQFRVEEVSLCDEDIEVVR